VLKDEDEEEEEEEEEEEVVVVVRTISLLFGLLFSESEEDD